MPIVALPCRHWLPVLLLWLVAAGRASAGAGVDWPVVDADRQPLGAAELYLYWADTSTAGGRRRHLGSVAAGILRWTPDWPLPATLKPAPRWRLALHDGGAGPLWRSALRAPDDHDLVAALASLGTLLPGTSTTLQLPRPARRELLLRDEHGAPAVGIELQLAPLLDVVEHWPHGFDSHPARAYRSDGNGLVRFEDVPGDVLVQVEHYLAAPGQPGKWLLQRHAVPARLQQSQQVSGWALQDDARMLQARWQAPPPRPLQLCLRTAQGEPARGVLVQVNAGLEADAQTHYSAADGCVAWQQAPELVRSIGLGPPMQQQALSAAELAGLLAAGRLQHRWNGAVVPGETLPVPAFALQPLLPVLLRVELVPPARSDVLFRLDRDDQPLPLVRDLRPGRSGWWLALPAGSSVDVYAQARPRADELRLLPSARSPLQQVRMAAAPTRAPLAPGALAAEPLSPYALRLRWQHDGLDVYGFELVGCTPPPQTGADPPQGCVRLALPEHDVRDFELHRQPPGIAMRYQLRAFNEAGASEPAEVSVTLPPDPQFDAALAAWQARHAAAPELADEPRYTIGTLPEPAPEAGMPDFHGALGGRCVGRSELLSQPQLGNGTWLAVGGQQQLDDGRTVDVFHVEDPENVCSGCPTLAFGPPEPGRFADAAADCRVLLGSLEARSDQRPERVLGWARGTGGIDAQLLRSDSGEVLDAFTQCMGGLQDTPLAALRPPFWSDYGALRSCQFEHEW